MDIVDVVWRNDDAYSNDGANAVGTVDAVVDEVAVDSSATVGDEVEDVAVDEVVTATGPEGVRSRSRRTPPALMLKWTIPNAMSIPPRRPEKAECDAKAGG
jgi:hypothetical protein